jgi:hypothetical protein
VDHRRDGHRKMRNLCCAGRQEGPGMIGEYFDNGTSKRKRNRARTLPVPRRTGSSRPAG